MKLAILGAAHEYADPSSGNLNYRGTDRTELRYCDNFDEHHPVNQAFLWWVHNSDDAEQRGGGLLHDLDKAHELVRIYKQYANQDFEIIEITNDEEMPQAGEKFLGFDISVGYISSLLWNGLRICHKAEDVVNDWDPERGAISRRIRPLVCLIEEHFRPKLNANGLFADYETARFCLDCWISIEGLVPGAYEHRGKDFEILGLYKVE